MSHTTFSVVSLLALYLGVNCVILVCYIRSLSRFYREAQDGWRRALEMAKESGERAMLNLRLAADLSEYVPPPVATAIWQRYAVERRSLEHDA